MNADDFVVIRRDLVVALWNYAMEYLDPGDRWDDESVRVFREVSVYLGYPDDFKDDWDGR